MIKENYKLLFTITLFANALGFVTLLPFFVFLFN